MSDIGTALRKALSEWDTEPPTTKVEPEPTPPGTPHFAVTNNVCRATFDCIKNNPGSTRKEIIAALTAQGYKAASTTTLIGQMLKQNHVRELDGGLFATSDQYVPLKGSKAWAKLQAAPRKKVTLVSKRTGEALSRPVQEAPQIDSTWNVTDQLNSMSIVQARLMYDALRKIFGG